MRMKAMGLLGLRHVSLPSFGGRNAKGHGDSASARGECQRFGATQRSSEWAIRALPLIATALQGEGAAVLLHRGEDIRKVECRR